MNRRPSSNSAKSGHFGRGQFWLYRSKRRQNRRKIVLKSASKTAHRMAYFGPFLTPIFDPYFGTYLAEVVIWSDPETGGAEYLARGVQKGGSDFEPKRGHFGRCKKWSFWPYLAILGVFWGGSRHPVLRGILALCRTCVVYTVQIRLKKGSKKGYIWLLWLISGAN